MGRLIWGFACPTYHIVGNLMSRLTSLFQFSKKMLNSYKSWNSQNACQKSKQGRPWSGIFFRSSLICGCTVCLGLLAGNYSFWNFRNIMYMYVDNACHHTSHIYKWVSLWQNLSSGFPTKQGSNQSPLLQRLARKLKFCLKEVEIWYFPVSE